MENASKALIMAGSILIALLTIGALVLMFDNISEIERQRNAKSEVDDIVEFNSQFEAFDMIGLRGSDLISLINKIHDFNESYLIEQGYEEIDMSIYISTDVGGIISQSGNIDRLYEWKKNASSEDLKEFKRKYFKCRGADDNTPGIEYAHSGRVSALRFREIDTTSL